GSAAPFRAAGTLAFGAAVWAVYVMAVRCGLAARPAFGLAALFALHPFNSWFYFQGWWIGNSLMVAMTPVVWTCYKRAAADGGRMFWAKAALVAGSVYASCLFKDTGILFVPMLLGPALFGGFGSAFRRWAAFASAAAGGAVYFLHRMLVMGAK